MNAVVLATEGGYRWKTAGDMDQENRLAEDPDFICIVPVESIEDVMAMLSEGR